MLRGKFHHAWLAALAAVAAVALVLAGVGCPPREGPAGRPPLTSKGAPTIRVLIFTGPSIPLGTTGPYRIISDGQIIVARDEPLAVGMLSRSGEGWAIRHGSADGARFPGRRLTVEGVGSGYVQIGQTSYRGQMVIEADKTGRIRAVNHIDLENYLAGVLRKELYAEWHIRTYRAQAIAARTYAMYKMATNGKGRPYDVFSTQASQVYGGVAAETAKSRRAVADTRGIVLAAGPEGNEKIFCAYYSSNCGGLSNPAHALEGPTVTSGPLAGGVVCNDCQSAKRYSWPPVTVSKSLIHRALAKKYREAAKLPGVAAVKVVSSFHGRPIWVDIVGTDGKKVRIRAADLRLALLRTGDPSIKGLHSANFRIRDAAGSIMFDQGRGFGHSVGMCQWGAEGKARRGVSVESILQTYYPTSKLFRSY